ncbi:MAG: sulfatase-like hydrolase/transferase [Gammaproteobacteria bacterium]|nr:sulfatase-like hydrolase/transferase [Gammaproteobacteria bacterium]
MSRSLHLSTRLKFSLSLLLLSALLLSCSDESVNKEKSQPNVILILTDDQGYADVGVYGARDLRTPNLDKLAAEGIQFLDFYAQPFCGPTRASLLTGSYPIRIAEPENKKHPNTTPHSQEITIAEVLKEAGYATAVIGKWHLAGDGEEPWDFVPPPLPPGRPGGKGPFIKELMPKAQGFDYFFGTPMHNGFTKLVDNRRFIAELMRNDEVVQSPLDMDQLTKTYTKETLNFIRKNQDQPFFIYLAHTMPHTPLGASKDFRGKSARGLYGDAVEELDWSVGQIVAELKKLNLDKDTLVIFASDNGPEVRKELGDHIGDSRPLRGGKYSNWEGGVRVPAIMHWPGQIPEGLVSREIVSIMDLYPTVTKLAGAELPQDRAIDGKSILPLMFNQPGASSPHKSYFYYSLSKLQAVRKDEWKLVLPRKTDSPHMLWLGKYMDTVERPQLFNLNEDIAEEHDLAHKKPELVAELMNEIEWARSELGDYNRIGKSARFFDDGARRPLTYFQEE